MGHLVYQTDIYASLGTRDIFRRDELALSRISGPRCSRINHTHYMVSSIYFGIIDLSKVLVDVNIYMGLLFIYMCVQILIQRLRNIEKEIELMHQLQRNGQTINLKLHQKWRQKLNQHITLIARDAGKLKSLAEELFSIYQLQLLFLLFTSFLSLVALMFYIICYIADFQNIEIIQLLFLLYVLVTDINNVSLLYNICELLINSFKEMGHLVYQTGIYASLGTRDIFRRDDLTLSLELLLLQLQYREFKFSVCGIFVINNSTCMSLISSVVLNLLYLIQSVVQLL
ncbi:hypothetical protein FF38_09879 [Lucilia cuprina]|uniref:Gustatory receptor n=1 Tax=Lucilia cuprina TaxID=7375 RepID=A0A0L0CMG9_LUCCU|nr:hypothetical protein FF38_09879 [Lucilia cuprina]